ncbi:MAG TPA: hypothetical protein VJZ77_09295 [Blastocatellia bacterium]|nr:hypothetical protein [Blastocatellia bacterium]
MTLRQIEHAATMNYADELPAGDTLDRMEALFRERRSETVVALTEKARLKSFTRRFTETDEQAANRRAAHTNRLNQADLRRREIKNEIVEVARLIVAEADNAEIIAALEDLAAEQDTL